MSTTRNAPSIVFMGISDIQIDQLFNGEMNMTNKEEVKKIKLSDIGVFDNSRGEYDNIATLMDSIKKNGLLQPIVLTNGIKNKKSGNKYFIVCGHRRFYAHEKLGKKTINATFKNEIKDEKELILNNLTENIHRQDTLPFEDGRFFKKLTTQYGLKTDELAVRLSIPKSRISNCIKIFNVIPEKYRGRIKHIGRGKTNPGEISVHVAARLAQSLNEGRISKEQLINALDSVVNGNLRNSELSINTKTLTNIDTFLMIGFKIRFKKNEIKKALDKYECGPTELMKKVVFGEIKETFTRVD